MRRPTIERHSTPALPEYRPASALVQRRSMTIAPAAHPRRRRNVRGEKLLTVAQLFDGRRTLPMIRMRGEWLRRLGFLIGHRVVVRVERDRIVLTPASEE